MLGVKGDGKSKKKAAGRPKGSKGKEKDSTFRPKLFDRERDRGVELDGAGLKGKTTPIFDPCYTLACSQCLLKHRTKPRLLG